LADLVVSVCNDSVFLLDYLVSFVVVTGPILIDWL